MCQSKVNPASAEQLANLRDPAALAALEVLQKNGWLAVDVQSLNQFFAPEPGHPAKAALTEDARNGGQHAVLQFAVLLSFAAVAIVITSFLRHLTPTVFVLWGALGVTAGLLVSKYPGRFYAKRNKAA